MHRITMHSAMRYLPCALVLVSSASCLVPESVDPIDATRDRKSGDPPSPVEMRTLASSASAKRLVVLGKRSSLTVSGHDSVMGDHALTFDRWVAHVEPGPPLKLVVDIDLRSLRSSESVVESIVKDHLLEVDKHGHAYLVANLSESKTEGDVVVIDGTADIKGTKGPIKFTGKVAPEADAFRFEASFPMSRRAFGLVYSPVEPFLDDTFRVTVNAVASPERVDAVEMD
jgi:polyisoprenoid-binding protein YceI